MYAAGGSSASLQNNLLLQQMKGPKKFDCEVCNMMIEQDKEEKKVKEEEEECKNHDEQKRFAKFYCKGCFLCEQCYLKNFDLHEN